MGENIYMRAVIYGRSTTWRADRDLVAEQMAQCKAFALHHGMTIVAAFEDHGASGSRGARPGLRALTAATGRRQIDAVVVRDLDRLTRDAGVMMQILKAARGGGVEIITVAERTARGSSGSEGVVDVAA